ncbi:MAG: glycosyltransferase family 2 protein [Pseudomonadota bacterium]|nr:glycosyltransferase family 2 protein [Pseudomonadota bacterium]
MTEQPRVTVVIPAYRAERTIRRAVDSALAQEGVDLQVVAVVDGRLDRTAELLAGYDTDRLTVVVNEENQGSQISRNKGLAVAEGEFVMFLDCDDFLEGPLLSGLSERLREQGADIAFGPMQVMYEETGRRRPTILRDYRSTDDLVRAWLAEGKTMAPCSILWRTEFLRAIGGWNERIKRNQDGEVVMRTIFSGARFALSAEGRGVYVNHNSPHRITRRPENLASSLDVGEALLAMDSPTVSESAKREGLSGYFYRIALRLSAFGRPDLGERAFAKARELGHPAPARYRYLARLLGVPARAGIFGLDKTAFVSRVHLGLTALLIRWATPKLSEQRGGAVAGDGAAAAA